LQSVPFPETFLHRVKFAVACKALDSRYRRAVGLNGEHGARFYGLPIDHYCASSAKGGFASDVRSGESKDVAQVMDEQKTWFDLVLLRHSVDGNTDSSLHKLPHFVAADF
jgi:hypothetical protein